MAVRIEALKTSRCQFHVKAGEYLQSMADLRAGSTLDGLSRRYMRIGNEIMDLAKKKQVSTTTPKSFTPEDVKNYILYRKGLGVSASDISHDISALKNILEKCGNGAVKQALIDYPSIKPVRKRQRLDPLSIENYQILLDEVDKVNMEDFTEVRALTLVLLYVCTGARNMELRLAARNDLDLKQWIIHFENVKGGDSYGSARYVPIPKRIQPLVTRYLCLRDEWLSRHEGRSEALFFAMDGAYGYLSGNAVRTIKSNLARRLGIEFQLRDARRFFGQHYLDLGLPLQDVSALMGHNSMTTTQMYYGSPSLQQATASARKFDY